MSSDNHATAWKQEPDKTRVDNKALLYPIYDIICENGQRVVRIYIYTLFNDDGKDSFSYVYMYLRI